MYSTANIGLLFVVIDQGVPGVDLGHVHLRFIPVIYLLASADILLASDIAALCPCIRAVILQAKPISDEISVPREDPTVPSLFARTEVVGCVAFSATMSLHPTKATQGLSGFGLVWVGKLWTMVRLVRVTGSRACEDVGRFPSLVVEEVETLVKFTYCLFSLHSLEDPSGGSPCQ
jgi:hypothetical protein